MGIKDAIYLFDKSVNIQKVINEILKNPRDQDLFKKLESNFVNAEQLIIQGNNIESLFNGDDIYYNFSLGGFVSNKIGFAQFMGVSILVISPILILQKNMFAYLVLPPLNSIKFDVTPEMILKIADEKKIKTEIKIENIEKSIKMAKAGRGNIILLTKGQAPQNGKVYKVKLYFNIDSDVGKKKEDGTIDYKDRDSVKNIKKGDILGEYTPEIKSVNGFDIFGDIIHARGDNQYTYIVQDNIEMAPNNKLIAKIDGIFQRDEEKISISDTLVIPGDIDLSIGNVKSYVSVLIKGKVNQGFNIEVGKDLTVREFINKSNVRVGGSLKVRNGIIGEGSKYKVIVKDYINAEYMENSDIWCGGDIEIEKSIVHSDLSCAGKLFSKTKGIIIGGKIFASKGVEVNEIGSKISIPTTIIVGIDLKREIRQKELEKKLNLIDVQATRAKLDIGEKYFEDPEKYIESVPEEKLDKLENLLNKFVGLMDERKIIEDELTQLNKAINYKDAKIIIRNIAYDGVSLFFGNNRYDIKKPVRGMVFYWNDTEKKVMSKPLS